jgi:hypothetical protein
MQSLAAAIANELAERRIAPISGPASGRGPTTRSRRGSANSAANAWAATRSARGSPARVSARCSGSCSRNGAAVVLKLFPPTFVESELRAIERCIAELVAAGSPMPRPLGPLFQAGAVWAAFSELVDGRVLDADEPAVRCTLAEMLAELARLALDPRDLPLVATRRTTLWAAPHRLDLDYARPGGAWIDARASAAQRIARSVALPETAAHSDWSTKNALFRDGWLCTVLDWDSLDRASEAEMVGRAAAELTAQ